MSTATSGYTALPLVHLAVVENEHSDGHGYLHSNVGLRFMIQAAVTIAGRSIKERIVPISTETVMFLQPVPVGHNVAYRAVLSASECGNLRLLVEGRARFGRNDSAQIVMTGSFILEAIDSNGQPMPFAKDELVRRVA